MKSRVVSALLLAAILIYGGALRFVGQNWDDFSHTHPDELFLTLLVLPNIGGQNNFTEDRHGFPAQQILVLRDSSAVRSREELASLPAVQLGLVRDSFAAQASGWIVSGERAQFFDSFGAAQNALIARQVDALLVGSGPSPDHERVEMVDSISSVELQAMRCRRLHPKSGGNGGYFDTRCSPLNPHNAGHGFFVYGSLPLLLAHYGSEFVRAATNDGLPFFDYQGGHLVWRGFSMIFDMLSILVIYALGARTHNRWVGLVSALLYAAAPLAIQKAHFGTVNAIAAFFVVLSLYFAVRVQQRGGLLPYLLFGIACGMAVASRVNLAPLAGIIIVPAALQALPAFDRHLDRQERAAITARHLAGLLLAAVGACLAFRICNPYAFTGPGFFGLLPNERWLANLDRKSVV